MDERIPARFWAKADQSAGPDGCWPWTAAKMWNGYGVFRFEERTVGAHRVAYILTHGPIPGRLEVDHGCHNGTDCKGGSTCRHRLCVNPAHLSLVTHRQNNLLSHVMGAATECSNGHEYTPENVYIWPKNGQRYCRTCQRATEEKRRESRKLKRRKAA